MHPDPEPNGGEEKADPPTDLFAPQEGLPKRAAYHTGGNSCLSPSGGYQCGSQTINLPPDYNDR